MPLHVEGASEGGREKSKIRWEIIMNLHVWVRNKCKWIAYTHYEWRCLLLGPPLGRIRNLHTHCSVHLRFNNIKVITIIALAYNEIAWFHLPLEHRIQHLVHLQQEIGREGERAWVKERYIHYEHRLHSHTHTLSKIERRQPQATWFGFAVVWS